MYRIFFNMLKSVEDLNKNKVLYFPLGKLNRDESIFKGPDQEEFTEKFKPIFFPILGKQLALNTYYQNELIAMANTPVSIELLKIFDRLKINFQVNYSDLTEREKNQAIDCVIAQIFENKKALARSIKHKDIPEIQDTVHRFISAGISRLSDTSFQSRFKKIQSYLEFACDYLTSSNQYVEVAASLKKLIEKEQTVFRLGRHSMGETLEHSLKTTWLSLILARETGDFDDKDYKRLSVICMAHDCGKALIPESIIYKKGRLTRLELEIMKSHVLFSYIISSNSQTNLDFKAFVTGLHHIKENRHIPLSYGIIPDTHTSFFSYLTPEAQEKLKKNYDKMIKYYRLMSIADTFEAISAERVYKASSSIGKTIEIMLKENLKNAQFYTPYLNIFTKAAVKYFLPRNMIFKISDVILETYYKGDDPVFENKKFYQKYFQGVIVNPSDNYLDKAFCMIYNRLTDKVDRHLNILPCHLLEQRYFR